MDLLIKEIKNGPNYIQFKLTAFNSKGRFVVDHFNPYNPMKHIGKTHSATVEKRDMDTVYKLIKLAGSLNLNSSPGFEYELKSENELR